MAKEAIFVQDGAVIDWINGTAADIAVGDVVPLTACVGVALGDIPNGAVGSVKLTGVWEMPKAAGTAFAVGDKLYWDTAASNLTKTDTATIPAGICVEAVAEVATVAKIKIG